MLRGEIIIVALDWVQEDQLSRLCEGRIYPPTAGNVLNILYDYLDDFQSGIFMMFAQYFWGKNKRSWSWSWSRQDQDLNSQDQDQDQDLNPQDQDQDQDLNSQDQDQDQDIGWQDQDQDQDLKIGSRDGLETRPGLET